MPRGATENLKGHEAIFNTLGRNSVIFNICWIPWNYQGEGVHHLTIRSIRSQLWKLVRKELSSKPSSWNSHSTCPLWSRRMSLVPQSHMLLKVVRGRGRGISGACGPHAHENIHSPLLGMFCLYFCIKLCLKKWFCSKNTVWKLLNYMSSPPPSFYMWRNRDSTRGDKWPNVPGESATAQGVKREVPELLFWHWKSNSKST